MIYHFSLPNVALVTGIILCLLGAAGLVASGALRALVPAFPRHRLAGIVLLSIALIWSFWLLATMEMGEFAVFRRPFEILLPIAFFLTIRFVDEFLAVRALGILALLAAEPMLDAAFFRTENSRLVLTAFAYILIVLGLFWVTMPYLLRDQIAFLRRTATRWVAFVALIFVYGATLVTLALTTY